MDFAFVINNREGCYAFREPYVSSYHAIVSNDGIASEDAATSVEDYMVSNGWVALGALGFFLDSESAKGNALVDLYVGADNGGLTDDYACAVVDEEGCADVCCGVDVDAGFGVGVFGNYPRDDGYI